MNRREFVAALGASGLLAGCLAGGGTSDGTTPASGAADTPEQPPAEPTSTPTSTSTPTPTDGEPTVDPEHSRLAVHGIPPDICEGSINPTSGIYAIVDPAFASDWSDHEITPAYRHDPDSGALVDEQTVIGLAAGGTARAYPLTVLNTHEIVNDSVGPRSTENSAGSRASDGGPVMVTYCPLCSSGMVASRRIRGGTTLFAVTGLLWIPERVFARASAEQNRTFGASYSRGERTEVRYNGNLVMYDAATRTYWSQMLARGICGPLAGTELTIRPSTVATWGEWRERHPDTDVLLPPPHSKTVEPGVILGEGGTDAGAGTGTPSG